ncbi:hypothetical protein CERZMDRAFT_91231 [Cercospora zeae-maydis SCOH1-5]|uniref:Uncharacterized protein n=1 Tax=Cercospora zeae-maydis SCOH1-5 TaxID=717836 RepID=A0A6A6F9M0_9PEZI|nr:hypothetical protein CERZMDRAFT_91231 [Cercospora zeae-maydis SCOH1-5]
MQESPLKLQPWHASLDANRVVYQCGSHTVERAWVCSGYQYTPDELQDMAITVGKATRRWQSRQDLPSLHSAERPHIGVAAGPAADSCFRVPPSCDVLLYGR